MHQLAAKTVQRSSLMASYSELLGGAILRHRAEIAEKARRLEAEETSEIKSQFIANMSHELRTPLNAIIGFSKILHASEHKPLEPAKVADYAATIHDAAQNLLHIINEILDISKIQSGRISLDRQPVSIGEILESCLSLIRLSTEEGGLTLAIDIAPDLPLIGADLVKIRQIFINLLSNAVKFTPRGGTIAIIAHREPGGLVAVTVADTGQGMTGPEIATALTPFSQIETELSRSHQGTGLGLPIAKSLAELHGGSLIVTSTPGAGTRIKITLPADDTTNKTPTNGRDTAGPDMRKQ